MFLPLCFGLCCFSCLLCAAFGVIKNNNNRAPAYRFALANVYSLLVLRQKAKYEYNINSKQVLSPRRVKTIHHQSGIVWELRLHGQ